MNRKEQLQAIKDCKTAIKNAIIEKGGSVGAFNTYATAIANLSGDTSALEAQITELTNDKSTLQGQVDSLTITNTELTATISSNTSAFADIKTAIENKGGTVSGGYDTYDEAIANLPSGGGSLTNNKFVTVENVGGDITSSHLIFNNDLDFSVELGDSITGVGYSAFVNLPITSVQGNNITRIYGEAFKNTKLTTVDFPALTSIGYTAFYGCNNLTTIDTSNVTSIDNQCFGCDYNLTELDLGNCTFVGWNALGNTGITELDLKSLGTIGNYSLSDMYYLTTVRLPVCTKIGEQAFMNDSSLSAIYVLGNTVAVLDNTNAFDNTQISSGQGTIYVPRYLENDYKNATNWCNYADYIVGIGSVLSLTGATEGTVMYCNGTKLDSATVFEPTTYTFYNKTWGKTQLTVNPTDGDTVTANIVAPTDYKTVTYNGFSDGIISQISSIKVLYDDVVFEYDSFPFSIGVPSGTELKAVINVTGHLSVSNTTIITDDITVSLTDPEESSSLIINKDNFESYKTDITWFNGAYSDLSIGDTINFGGSASAYTFMLEFTPTSAVEKITFNFANEDWHYAKFVWMLSTINAPINGYPDCGMVCRGETTPDQYYASDFVLASDHGAYYENSTLSTPLSAGTTYYLHCYICDTNGYTVSLNSIQIGE